MTDTAVRRAPVTLDVNGVRHPLEPPGLVIGRGTQSDLRIDDPGVSRRHAEFRVQPAASAASAALVSVVDLGSTNGTLVNGRRVQHAILEDGAVVQIGGTTIRVHLAEPSVDPSSRPAAAAPPQEPPYQVRASYPSYPPVDPQPPGR
jgi:pSer/pThr/pTyr-binding forkhead associated (FHA) protein